MGSSNSKPKASKTQKNTDRKSSKKKTTIQKLEIIRKLIPGSTIHDITFRDGKVAMVYETVRPGVWYSTRTYKTSASYSTLTQLVDAEYTRLRDLSKKQASK